MGDARIEISNAIKTLNYYEELIQLLDYSQVTLFILDRCAQAKT